MKEILWLDDEIDQLEGFADRLRSLDVNVKVCTTIEECMELLGDWSPDTFIVDLNLQRDDCSGVEFLRVSTREYPSATHVALSSYLYRRSYIDALKEIEHPILQLDKILPPPESKEFQTEFLDLISEFSEKERESRASEIKNSEDPFRVTFKEWRSLTVLERDELDDAAERALEAQLEELFGGNAVWALYCGSGKRPKAVAENYDEIWADEDIIRFGRKQGYAPYTFLGPATIAEIWSAGCHPEDCDHNDGFSGYPTVRISLDSGTDVDSHFDTGSTASYFDYDGFREKGFVNVISAWASITLLPTGKRVKVRKEKREVLIRSQMAGGEACVVDVNATFVRDWFNFPYSKVCGRRCDRYSSENPTRYCEFRTCLVGRDILNNGVQVVLDSKSKKTMIKGGD